MSGYALVVVDMIKDNVNTQRHGLLDQEATKIIPNILNLNTNFPPARRQESSSHVTVLWRTISFSVVVCVLMLFEEQGAISP